MRVVALSAFLAIFGVFETFGSGFDLNAYQGFDAIQEHLRNVELMHPDLVELIEIGSSHENRSLTVVKLEDKSLKSQFRRPALWIDAGIHAREWIAVTTALNLIDMILKHPGIFKNLTIYVLPVVNPDGYEYSRTKDRFWRKNRRPAECGNPYDCCQGVDLNRNFDSDWSHFSHPPQARAVLRTQAHRPLANQNPEQFAIS
ncbi:hypothetical protein L596_021668 [Steinernema carpocapsae]|uniref:Peptidase M14 domain-containing protein n=1 Tax=Steinernema carpocapsae TaxID=34508 RepID=A0A4U5MJE7_STECR|nr:hypothetical protein L596_021668 [Steinernema carpocapsae]